MQMAQKDLVDMIEGPLHLTEQIIIICVFFLFENMASE